MTRSDDSRSNRGILGIFTELLGTGGVQEAGRQTAAAFANIAARRGTTLKLLGLNDPSGAQTLSVRGLSLPLTGFDRAKLRFVVSTIKQSRKNARILLAGHPNLAPPAALAKRLSPRLRTIVISHGVEVWEPLPAARQKALLAADLVLAPSSYTAQKLTQIQNVAPEKIRPLPWPLDPGFLALAADPSSLPLPPEFPGGSGKVILTVGRWSADEKYKGADQLIRAVTRLRAEFPDLSLAIVGNGDDLPRLKKIAADLKVANSVIFLEKLSRPQVAACYAKCDIFALPSTGEGFGFVFLEAMASAKPIVGVAKGGPIDLIRNGINGLLLPPLHEDALVSGLALLLRDPALRNQYGRKGAEVVRTEFTVDAFEKNLETTIAPFFLT